MTDIDQDERIRLLMRSALDDALKLQVGHLYQIWLSNPGDLKGQQARAATGASNAIKVYKLAVEAIENWRSEDA
jgi:hypothetical protein